MKKKLYVQGLYVLCSIFSDFWSGDCMSWDFMAGDFMSQVAKIGDLLTGDFLTGIQNNHANLAILYSKMKRTGVVKTEVIYSMIIYREGPKCLFMRVRRVQTMAEVYFPYKDKASHYTNHTVMLLSDNIRHIHYFTYTLHGNNDNISDLTTLSSKYA